MADYKEKLKSDLAEQFRGKINIENLIDVLGNELQQVFNFYEQLRHERSIRNAVGKQLDGVGDIVVLTRADAAGLAKSSHVATPLDDSEYRKYLFYKVWINTNDCTYKSIVDALKMFYDKPVKYIEDPERPATILLETEFPEPGDNNAQIMIAPVVKPAGVEVKYRFAEESRIVLGADATCINYSCPYCGPNLCGTLPADTI